MNIKECMEIIKKLAVNVNGKAVIEEDVLFNQINEYALSPEQLDKIYDEITNNNIKIVNNLNKFRIDDDQTAFANELAYALSSSVYSLINHCNSSDVNDIGRDILFNARETAIANLQEMKSKVNNETNAQVRPKDKTENIPKNNTLFMFKIGNIVGHMVIEKGVYIVQKGSTVKIDSMTSCPMGINERKQRLFVEGKLVEVNGVFVVQTDIVFKSPSRAAAFLCGSSVNGRVVWKNTEGKSLKELGL